MDQKSQWADGDHRPADLKSIDRQVGQRLQCRRRELGMSREAVATAIGASLTQLHCFEEGTARVGGERLLRLAALLRTSLGFFFEEAGGAGSALQQSTGIPEAA